LPDIAHPPVEGIVLHNIREVEKEEFVEVVGRLILRNHLNPEIFWSSGVTFILEEFMDTDRIVNDRLDGIEHYKSVIFTRMDFEPEIITVMQGRVGVERLENRRELIDIAKFLAAYSGEPVQ
jgi:hypothetical protein